MQKGICIALDIHQLTPHDIPLLRSLNTLFGHAFGEPDTYCAEPPSDAYLAGLLAKEGLIVLVALLAEQVVRAGPCESDNWLSLARLWERTSTDDKVDTQSLQR